MVVCIVLLSFAILSMFLRCFTRLFIVKGFGKDDYLMVFSAVSSAFIQYPHPTAYDTDRFIIQISFTLFITCAITGIHYGTGRHASDLSTDDFQTAMKVCNQLASLEESTVLWSNSDV